MVRIPAAQLIYTHVEREQSPRGIGGFQTLLYTRTLLTEPEVGEIEGRLLYQGPADGPVKRLFATAAGRCVVAQIVPLPEPDRLGRGGRYLAHALVLGSADFARLGADPWPLLERFPFSTTVEGALRQGDFRSGDIPAAALELPEVAEAGPAVDWPVGELARLALLALRAGHLAGERQAVAFIGDPRQVENALAAALVAVPIPLRLRCTFDTFFVRGNLVATYYWAVGLPEDPRRPNMVAVDAAGRRVSAPLSLQAETAYERWAVAALTAGDLAAFRDRETAYALAEWLEGRGDGALLEGTAPAVLEGMFRLNAPLVQARLRRRLEERLAPVLAGRILVPLYEQAAPPDLLRWLRAGLELAPLLDALYRAYEGLGLCAPARDEVRALGEALRSAAHPLLGVLLAAWTGRRQDLRRGLEALDGAAYRRFFAPAFAASLVDPLALAAAGHGETFVELYAAGVEERRQDLVGEVKVLLVVGEREALRALIPYLAGRGAPSGSWTGSSGGSATCRTSSDKRYGRQWALTVSRPREYERCLP